MDIKPFIRKFGGRPKVIFEDGREATAAGLLIIVQDDNEYYVLMSKEQLGKYTFIGDLGGKLDWEDVVNAEYNPDNLTDETRLDALSICAARETTEESNGIINRELNKDHYYYLPHSKYMLFIEIIDRSELPLSMTFFGTEEFHSGIKRTFHLIDVDDFLSQKHLHARLRRHKKIVRDAVSSILDQ